MRRNYGSFRNSGAYTSPGTPEHCEENPGEVIPKTWSSERVPLPTRRPALMPFNSGRALPSKWDDAERWITSPVSGYGTFKIQPQRQPKSKSGPLGPTGLVYVPTMAGQDGNVKKFMVHSPLTTGVLLPDGLSVHYEARIAARSKLSFDENINRSSSVPGLCDLISEASVPNSPGDDKMEGGLVLCRDVATQMSPEGSPCSSSIGRLSFSNLPSASLRGDPAEKDEIRDVQVDKGVTPAREHAKKKVIRSLANVDDLPAAWDVTEASKSHTSKLQREESKITAWENLQKAKAEAAIRKLEMKLERKRSASMDNITSKLRVAQMKAQAARESLLGQPHGHSRKSFSRCIYVKKTSLFNCFVCSKSMCLK